mmetsp:Transcript_7654/g.16850  ORF Transcript_7654/g.16850 Transcript_7654/m.16850 type:complete len:227 (-) Transcript_7654:202-882(-)|eukprot:CAMPEP_0178411088 /NCGR_PEP_ID=MMETSP0689_2-20121128/21316_1 /TAXON_ID=160604 /ORGANISM="Amphidinium massartii, Strain CS-259" /LENGTH=226 /DNA_ID=CAMNT_0020032287 /DNA_START=90 /DNA_END=770 /DNA_ORIENTATION=-
MGAACSTSDPSGPVKFSYFPLTARGLPVVLAMEHGGVKYDGKAIAFDDWPKMKESGVCPFGYLCLLELPDGTKVNETNACLLTVGKIGNLLGSTLSDFATSNMLACKAAEVMTDCYSHMPLLVNVKDWNSTKADKLKEFLPKLQTVMEQFDKLCHPDGTFTGDVTVGELHLWALLYEMKRAEMKVTLPANLQKFYDRIEKLPATQKVITGKSGMGEMMDYMVPVPA